MTRASRLAPLAALLATSSGCMFWVVGTEIEAGATLPAPALEAIRPGTTAREVVERLGPPTAVLRAGEVVRVPGFDLRKVGARELDGTALLARFSSPERPPGPSDLVYFYEAVHVSRPGHYTYLIVWNAGGATQGSSGTDRVRTERLILLVDAGGRIVRDLIHEVEPPEAPGEPARQEGSP